MASALAVAGLVVFATAASAHNNSATATSYPCASPLGTGVTITWTISNDYAENETGTVSSVNGGTIAYQGGASNFSIGNNGTTTVTQTFTGPQLANLLATLPGPNHQISLQWSATWHQPPQADYSDYASPTHNSGAQGFFNLSQLPNGCVPQKVTPTITTTANPTSGSIGGAGLNDSAHLSGGNSPGGTIDFYLFKPSQTCTTSPGAGTYTFHQSVSVTSGNGTYSTSGGPSPNSLGTWHWLAVYSGDSNNYGANSGCTTEPVTVGMQSPSLTTTANPTNETVGAGPLADSATLSGGYNPGGTISFYLFSPSQTCSTTPGAGSYTFHQQFSVTSGNGTYGPTTGGPTPNSAGTWHWLAVYSGDSNNSGTNSGCTSEPVTVGLQSPSLGTTANPTTELVGSGPLADSATLSGGYNPGGTITFYLFSPSQTCSTTPGAGSYTFHQQFSVTSGNGTYGPTTGGPTPNSAGTWHWLAVYSGDSNNNGTNSGCTSEPVIVSAHPTTLTTQASPTSDTVGSSTALSDSATLSSGYSPSGTIDFYLFSPSQTCSTTPGAGSYTFHQQFSVTSGNGTYGPTTGGPTPNSAGTWHWLAVYSGDSNNSGANSGCTSEPVTTQKASPSVNTQANPTTGTAGSGTLADSATLSGGYNPGGTITFYLFSPSQTCTTSPEAGTYTFHQQFSVDGNGSYGPTTGGPTPNSAGTWHWLAVYSGDSNNNWADSGCTSEPVTIQKASPSVDTQANPTTGTAGSGTLADSATLSAGVNPGGTIDFYLFSPSQTCSTTPGSGSYTFHQQFSVTSGNGTYGPTTGGPTPNSAGTWHWLAVYSGDSNNNGANSGCTSEPVTIQKASPSVDTQANPTTGTAGSGTLADSATLSGAYNAGGTITFYLFSPSQTCTTSPEAGTYTFHQQFSVDGNGSYGPTTGGPTPNSAGTWHWLAVYSGDSNNNGANSGCTSEPVTIQKASPSVDTATDPTTTAVGATALTDSATLSAGVNPGGTITFYLFDPSQTCSATPESGTYAFTTIVNVTDGNGTYGPVTGPVPNVKGTWNWLAVYSGDANNNGADSGCGNEPVTVNPAPSTTTTQQSGSTSGSGTIVIGQSITDTATVQGNVSGGAPTGSVHFYQCGPGSSPALCTTANPVGTGPVDLTPVGGTDTSTATSAPFTPSAVGTYCFAAVYTPDESSNYVSSADNLADHNDSVSPSECFLVTAPNFTVVKTNVPTTGTSVPTGATINYTVAVKNVGNGAGSATVTDVVPSSLTVTGTPSCAVTGTDTCKLVNTTGTTWTITVSLAAGDTATASFATTVNAGVTGTITNTATITDGPCTTSSGCSSTVSNPVTPVTTAATVTPTTTTTTAPPKTAPATAIAFTGALLSEEWLIGLGALLLGAGLVVVARWRRRTPKHAAK